MAFKYSESKPKPPRPKRKVPKGSRAGMGGRPEYQPTEQDRQFVSRATKAGSSQVDIAACLNISRDTLRKHFAYEIVTAREVLKASAIGVLEDSLQDGSLDAAKFVLARVAGWSEKQAMEHTSPDGSMTPKPALDLSGAPKEVLMWLADQKIDGDPA